MKKPQNEKGVIKKGTSKSIMRVRTSCRRQTYRKKRVREEKGKLWGVSGGSIGTVSAAIVAAPSASTRRKTNRGGRVHGRAAVERLR